MGNIAFNALQRPALQVDDHPPRRRPRRRIRQPPRRSTASASARTSTQKIIRSLLAKIPLKLNVTITGPFRALIATAKSFNDPRQVIKDVLPRPLDEIPGITTEVRRVEENQQQTQTAREPSKSTLPRHPTEVREDDETQHYTPGLLAAALLAAPLASCISVKAPDKPIEINLNVTIRQEVLVRLQRDVEQLINQNPQAFPTEAAMRKLASFLAALAAGCARGGADAGRRLPRARRASSASATTAIWAFAAPASARCAARSRGSTSSAARSTAILRRAAARARRTSASPPAASCSRGSGSARPICWATASGGGAPRGSRRPCPITAAELRTSCAIFRLQSRRSVGA